MKAEIPESKMPTGYPSKVHMGEPGGQLLRRPWWALSLRQMALPHYHAAPAYLACCCLTK